MKYITALMLMFNTYACTSSKPPVSEVAHLSRGKVFRQVTILGRVRSENVHVVRSPIDGQLVTLNKSIGANVKPGDILAEVELPKTEEKMTSLIQDQGRLSQIQIEKTKIRVKIDAAQRQMQSSSRLLASKSISNMEQQESVTSFKLSQNELAALESEEKTILKSMAVKSKGRTESSRKILSSITGTISQIWTDPENVTIGMTIPKDTILMTIEEPGSYVIKGEILESDFLQLSQGQGASVSLVHKSDQPWKGAIKTLSPFPKQDGFGLAKFEAIVTFNSGNTLLRSGLEARAVIAIAQKENVLQIPRSALKQLDDKSFQVSTPTEKGTVYIPVQIGLLGDENVEILGGLQENQAYYASYAE